MRKIPKALLAFFCIALMSVNVNAQKKINIRSLHYPPDFATIKSSVLVIQYDDKSETPRRASTKGYLRCSKDIEELFPKYYTGDYNFVTIGKDIEQEPCAKEDKKSIEDWYDFKVINPAYSNIDKYRYVLYFGLDNVYGYSISGYSLNYLELYDRKDKISYAWPEATNGKGKRIENYVTKLEEVRAK